MNDTPSKSKWGELDLRVYTGLVIFAAVVALVLFSPLWTLCLVVAAVAGLAMWEYLRLALPGAWRPDMIVGLVLAGVLPLAVPGGAGVLAASLGLALVLSSLASLLTGGDDIDQALQRGLRVGWGTLYTGGCLACLAMVAALTGGRLLFLYGVVVVAAADVGAYFVGKFIGKHKLAPRLSPGKSIEGGLGGLATGALVGGLYAWLFLADTSMEAGAGLGALLAVLSVGGDLLESSLKRAAGVKDSSNLLPGHGGILDRVDGHLAAAPGLLLVRMLWWG